MKQTVKLICAACGCEFTAEADYILPGISGFVVNKSGEQTTFLDPTEEHHCKLCVAEAIAVIWRDTRLNKGEET